MFLPRSERTSLNKTSLISKNKHFAKITIVTSIPLLASFKVTYRIVKCKKPHWIGESLVLPVIGIIETIIGKSHAKELQ
jgi:hypothetical protein